MKELSSGKWGLLGNSRIKDYSMAPVMWRKLFERLNMPVDYFVLGFDDERVIKNKINLFKKDARFIGANIALPWKKIAYNLCDKTYLPDKSEVVNIIVKNKKGELIGYNSDGEGLVSGIKKCTNIKKKNIVIFGAGGSAQTIPFYLLENGAKSVRINDIVNNKAKKMVARYAPFFRQKKSSIVSFPRRDILINIKRADILINATPCGMTGYKEKYPFGKRLVKKT